MFVTWDWHISCQSWPLQLFQPFARVSFESCNWLFEHTLKTTLYHVQFRLREPLVIVLLLRTTISRSLTRSGDSLQTSGRSSQNTIIEAKPENNCTADPHKDRYDFNSPRFTGFNRRVPRVGFKNSADRSNRGSRNRCPDCRNEVHGGSPPWWNLVGLSSGGRPQ